VRDECLKACAYDDLERYDDEAFTAASLGVILALGPLVGVSTAQLLLGDDLATVDAVTFETLSQALRDHLATQSVTVEQVGDSIGWDVSGLLETPARWLNEPVEVLYVVSRRLNIDWVAALRSVSALNRARSGRVEDARPASAKLRRWIRSQRFATVSDRHAHSSACCTSMPCQARRRHG
jgi:hypothetical protein